MRLKKSCFLGLVLTVVLSLSLATPAIAVPQIPHAFYGTVTVGVGNEPVPKGTDISAKIGGEEYATTTTADGKYGYSPTFKVPGDDPDTPEVEGGVGGDTIEFYIEGIQVTTYTFANGEVTPLPLHIEELPAPPPSGGGGVGPSPIYTETNLFGAEERIRINSDGEIQETIEATSADGMLTLTILEDTVALDEDGDPLESLEVAVDETPPDPPEGAYIIELAYDFGPDGATFDPPITLEYTYDPDDFPEGVAEEDLVLAYYDEDADEWVELDCVVDTVNNTITADVEHFTTFAIIGAVTPPEEEEVVPPEEEEEVVPPEEEEVVLPPEEEVVPPEEEEVVPAKPPVNWPVLGGIIGGVIVLGLIIFLLVKRRA